MGKSIREYFTALGYWGWVVVADFIWAGIGLYRDIATDGDFPTWLWILSGLLALLVTPFVIFHKVRVQRDNFSNDLEIERDKRPDINVSPVCEGKLAKLEVKNIGKYESKFTTKVSGWLSTEQSIALPVKVPYKGRWRENDSSEVNILPRVTGEIPIIINDCQTLDDKGKEDSRLRKLNILSQSDKWETKAHIGTQLEFTIEVFSSPDLKIPYCQTYVLTLAEDGWEQFEEKREKDNEKQA